MKVLSIKEPWSSLIINGYKEYEFRNLNTKYRGKILIHSSLKNDPRISQFKNLNLNYHPGYIIGEATIKETLEITPKLTQELIKKNPLVYTPKINESKYAWHLVDIKKYEKPIKAKGNLGLWKFYSFNEVLELMDNISYGWKSKTNQLKTNIDDTFFNEYELETPKEVIKNKIGVCWDQVELERYYFRNQCLELQTYFIVYYGSNKCPTHTFLTLKKDGTYYWFEHSWAKYRGIYAYSSKKALLNDVKAKFIPDFLPSKYNPNNIAIYPYSKPKSHLSAKDFFTHCENNPNIIKDLEEVIK